MLSPQVLTAEPRSEVVESVSAFGGATLVALPLASTLTGPNAVLTTRSTGINLEESASVRHGMRLHASRSHTCPAAASPKPPRLSPH